MELRTARRGRNAGGRFYGCSQYPKCKGTLDYNTSAKGGTDNEAPQSDSLVRIKSLPQTLIARSRIEGYHVRFFESAILPKSIYDALRELDVSEVTTRAFSQWRIDYPPAENPFTLSERESQVISVTEKILTRGKITICSPYVEEALEKLAFPGERNTLTKEAITYILTFCYSDNLTPWLDSPAETRYFKNCLPLLLGANYSHWVLPQVEISSLIGTNTANSINGRVDFLLVHPHITPIVVEIDGELHNDHIEADRQRDEVLIRNGYNVIRIPAQEVTANQGSQIDKLNILLNNLSQDAKKNNIVNERLANIIHASKYIHQIQMALVQAIQSGHLRLQHVDSWLITTDLHKTGYFTEAIARKILSIAVKDLLDLIVHLGHLYSIELCQGKPRTASDKQTGGFNIVFTGNSSGGIHNFYIQPVSVPFDIASSVFVSSPAVLDKPNIVELEYFLQYIFRKKNFWEGQYDAISRTLEGKDSIVLLPTGGGKSIAFQLASFLLPGRSLVIDPIISLMDDQIDNLRSVGVDRCFGISSEIENIEDKNRVLTLLGQGEYLFAYIAPERFQTIKFRESLRSLTVHTPIALVAVDEAHCVSEWGHDFRTAYLNLGRISRQYCESNKFTPPLLALTGTASRAVLKDVQRELQIEDFEAIITPKSFDRSELKFHVVNSSTSEKSARLIGMLSQMLPGKFSVPFNTFYECNGTNTYSGLVFCPHVNGSHGVVQQTEEIRKSISIPAEFYSGSQPKHHLAKAWTTRKQIVAHKFKHNKIPLLVCTKAFGMGIDKPNIRYTIHYGIPASIEAFYQEAGRAGRNREKAYCCVIVSDDDPQRTKKLLDPNTKAEEVASTIKYLNWQDNDDITRALYFQSKAFPGIETEKSKVLDIVKKIGDLFVKRECIIAYPSEDRAIYEKALHRLLLLGVVADYTINYSAAEFTINLSGFDKGKIIASFGNYVAGYLGGRKQAELEKAQKLMDLPIYDFITQMLDLLLRFIYDIIERGRRRALQEMLLAVTVSPNDEEVRKRILRYLEATEYSEILDTIIHENDAGIVKTIEVFDNVRSPNEASELRGQVSRYLESYPDHPGLLMLRALSEAYARDHNYQLVQQNLYASIFSCIENYRVEKKLMFEFAAWAISKIAIRNKQQSDLIQNILLNHYPERMFAQTLIKVLPRTNASISAWFMLDNIRKEVDKIIFDS